MCITLASPFPASPKGYESPTCCLYDAGSSNGIQLYRVVGSSVGDDAVIFRLGNQTLQVPIHVRSGVSPSGVSGGGMLYL